MDVILVHVGKCLVEDVLLDGGSKVNIITKNLCKKLGLPTPRLAPYILRMTNHTLTYRVNPRSKNSHTWRTLSSYFYNHAQ
jgi:hypothetical protein